MKINLKISHKKSQIDAPGNLKMFWGTSRMNGEYQNHKSRLDTAPIESLPMTKSFSLNCPFMNMHNLKFMDFFLCLAHSQFSFSFSPHRQRNSFSCDSDTVSEQIAFASRCRSKPGCHCRSLTLVWLFSVWISVINVFARPFAADWKCFDETSLGMESIKID